MKSPTLIYSVQLTVYRNREYSKIEHRDVKNNICESF